MSIYSWSIDHILKHEFFCLGWAGSKEKKSGFEFFWATFEGKKNLNFFENIVESFHIFLVILMILFTAEPLRFFIYISVCCWTFELSLLLNLWDYLLLLNLWIFFTAEPLNFFYCWTFEIMPWIMYLFAAEPLRRFSSKQNHQKSGPLMNQKLQIFQSSLQRFKKDKIHLLHSFGYFDYKYVA